MECRIVSHHSPVAYYFLHSHLFESMFQLFRIEVYEIGDLFENRPKNREKTPITARHNTAQTFALTFRRIQFTDISN